MRDDLEEGVSQSIWGSQGQPEVFPSNADLVSEGFIRFLDYLSPEFIAASSAGGKAARDRYINTKTPMWYHQL